MVAKWIKVRWKKLLYKIIVKSGILLKQDHSHPLIKCKDN